MGEFAVELCDIREGMHEGFIDNHRLPNVATRFQEISSFNELQFHGSNKIFIDVVASNVSNRTVFLSEERKYNKAPLK